MTDEQHFWADQVGQEIVQAQTKFVAATGITPSGEIHIGNLREVVTADSIVRVLKEKGKQVTFYYLADTFDPLRRVYPFLSPEKYSAHVGKPLSEIPCPCDKHGSYAEHFLEPFLRSLKVLDIQVEMFRVDQAYKEGKYVKNIVKALEATDKIRKILKEETGKETDETWSPFNPICNKCKRITGSTVTGFDSASKTVNYKCDCGDQGTVSMQGGGKLTWRVDWPARWEMLGVTIEPFGKDHASKGGSYDTGVRICREVFAYEPPFPIVYEWISLKGGGDMSSSKGNVISIHEMLEVLPPEVLKYAVIKVRVNRRIVFDPGLSLLSLMDEYDDLTNANRHHRAAEIAAVTHSPPSGVPFRHLVSLIQTSQGKVDEMVQILHRTGYPNVKREAIESRAVYARHWLDRFAPEEVKYELQQTLPPLVSTLSVNQKKALRLLGEKLKPGMQAEEIHTVIYSVKDEAGLSPNELFEAIYKSLLGKQKGPRAGFFLASLEVDFVKRRFLEAA